MKKLIRKKATKPEKYKASEVSKALTKHLGNVTVAASDLKCAPSTIYAYLKRYPKIEIALSDARESAIDYVESQLIKLIKEGNVAATIFFLKTMAKHRGYVERPEVALQADFEFTINIGDRDKGRDQ